ncbi:MAG: COG1361 S-layer family protein [Halobacteriota archaeon]
MTVGDARAVAVVALVVLSVAGAGIASSAGMAASADDATAAALSTDTIDQTGSFARGEPDLLAVLADPQVRPGTTETVEISLLNEGGYDLGGSSPQPRVVTARAVSMTAEAEDDAIEVESGTVAVGSVTTEQPASAPISLSVPEDLEPGEYDIDLEVDYTYSDQIDPGSNTVYEETDTEELTVTVVVDEGPRFEIVDAETDAQVGASGDVVATLQNAGERPARDASITASGSGGVVIGGQETPATGYVGDWQPGENRTIRFDSTVPEQFRTGGYVLETTVEYTDATGERETAPTSRAGVFPIAEQSFTLENVSDTLEVGYEGEITGTVRNDGPLPVTDAVVAIDPVSDRVSIDERRYALPALEPNESAPVRFTADVGGQADAGPRQVRFTIEYDTGEEVRSTEANDRVTIEPRTPEFAVEAENATVPAGESRTLTYTVTNQRPETLSSIRANLYADSPIDVVDDEAYVDELEPGESDEITLEVAAAGDANQKSYPLELDFRYEDEGRNDRISDVYDTPLEVTEPVESEGPSTTLLVGAALVVALAIGGAVWYRRR